jgi:signal transduction histidine kinase/ActR/RegA family two-component response regulator
MDPASTPGDQTPPNAAATGLVAATRRRTLARLKAVVWLSALLPLAALVAIAGWLYRQAMADANLSLDRGARIAQEHALKMFDTNEMLMQRMLDLLGDDDDLAVLVRSRDVHEQMREMMRKLPQVQGLFIIGSDGRALGTSVRHPPPREIDYSDREFFRWHRANKGEAVFFTEQLLSRTTREPFFDMSRRRNYADGSFGGTVNVSLRPEYLTSFYEELNKIDPALRFALVRSDGKLVARWPGAIQPGAAFPPDHPVMRQIAERVAAGRMARVASAFEAEERTMHFRRLDPYPLYVIASITHGDIVAAWRRQVLLASLLAVPLALGFCGMAWQARRRTRNEFDALQRLEAETGHRQRIELALLQSQKLEAMGRLTGGVAHDFNNLLMIVGTNLHLLRRKEPHLADSTLLSAMERAVQSGTKLTRQLLAFARKQALRPERVDLRERLPSLLGLLKPVLGSAIAIDGTVDPDTGAIEVDPAELELALINLAVNAKDAMPSGGRLEIRARNALPGEAPDGRAGYTAIEVCDTGSGISPELIGRVFDAFFTTKPVGYGTGLGLSQVQALAASAGGFARIENRAEGGTCVRLVLRHATAGTDAPSADALDQSPRELRCRVLLVEDNDAVAQATAELLRALGCTVARAADAASALALLEGKPRAFDIVLSDIEMPGGDGIALAAQVRSHWPHLPVLLMTGYAIRLEQAVKEKLDVLPKPCSPAVLADAIARILARRAQPQAVEA